MVETETWKHFFIPNWTFPLKKRTTPRCHSVYLPLHDFHCCKLTTRVYPPAFDETANENSASRLFSAEKWNYGFQLARRIFFALLLLRSKLFLADFNSTTWMPTCFNWLNMIYHLAECKAFVMQRNERRPSDWHLHSESEWVFCSVIIHHMFPVRDALWTITFLELATFGINLKASTLPLQHPASTLYWRCLAVRRLLSRLAIVEPSFSWKIAK